MIPVTGTGHTNIDVSANLELVDKFCYLDDMLRVNGCLQCFDTVGWAAGRASGL